MVRSNISGSSILSRGSFRGRDDSWLGTIRSKMSFAENITFSLFYTTIKGNSFHVLFSWFSLIIEFIQLLAFSVTSGRVLDVSVPALHTALKGVQSPGQAIFPTYNDFIGIFWVAVVFGILSCINLVYVMYSIHTHGTVQIIFFLRTVRLSISLFSTVLLIPFLYVYLAVLACDYSNNTLLLFHKDAIGCWSMPNAVPATFAVVLIIVFGLSMLLNVINFYENDPSLPNIIARPHSRFDLVVFFVKLLLTIIFDAVPSNTWLHVVVTVVSTMVLFVLHLIMLPSYNHWYNAARSGSYFCVCFLSVCSLAGLVLPKDHQFLNGIIPVVGIVMAAGIIPTLFIGAGAAHLRFRTLCNPELIVLPSNSTRISLISNDSSPQIRSVIVQSESQKSSQPNIYTADRRSSILSSPTTLKSKRVGWDTDVQSAENATNALSQFAKQLVFSTDVEIAARFAYNGTGKRANPENTEKALVIFRLGMRKFPHNSMVMMAYVNFLSMLTTITTTKEKQIKYHQLAVRTVDKLKKSQPIYDIRYFIFQFHKSREQLMEQIHGSHKNNQGTTDFVAYMEFKKYSMLARKSHVMAVEHIRRFWNHLLEEDVDFGKLAALSGKIADQEKIALESYKKLLTQDDKSPRIIRDYAKFIEEVVQDLAFAERIYKAADALEEKATGDHSAAHSGRQHHSKHKARGENDSKNKSQSKTSKHQAFTNDPQNLEHVLRPEELEDEDEDETDDHLNNSNDDGSLHYDKGLSNLFEDSKDTEQMSDMDASSMKSFEMSELQSESSDGLSKQMGWNVQAMSEKTKIIRLLNWIISITLLVTLLLAISGLAWMVTEINVINNNCMQMESAGVLAQQSVYVELLAESVKTTAVSFINGFTIVPLNNTNLASLEAAGTYFFIDNATESIYIYQDDSYSTLLAAQDQLERESITLLNIFSSIYYGTTNQEIYTVLNRRLYKYQYGLWSAKTSPTDDAMYETYFPLSVFKQAPLKPAYSDLIDHPTTPYIIPLVTLDYSTAKNGTGPKLQYTFSSGESASLYHLLTTYLFATKFLANASPIVLYVMSLLKYGSSFILPFGTSVESVVTVTEFEFITQNGPTIISNGFAEVAAITGHLFVSDIKSVINGLSAFMTIIGTGMIFLGIVVFRPIVVKIGMHKISTLSLFTAIPKDLVFQLANRHSDDICGKVATHTAEEQAPSEVTDSKLFNLDTISKDVINIDNDSNADNHNDKQSKSLTTVDTVIHVPNEIDNQQSENQAVSQPLTFMQRAGQALKINLPSFAAKVNVASSKVRTGMGRESSLSLKTLNSQKAVTNRLHWRYALMVVIITVGFVAWGTSCVKLLQTTLQAAPIIQIHDQMLTTLYRIEHDVNGLVNSIPSTTAINYLAALDANILVLSNDYNKATDAMKQFVQNNSQYSKNKFFELYVKNMYYDTCGDKLMISDPHVTSFCLSSSNVYYDLTSGGLSAVLQTYLTIAVDLYITAGKKLALSGNSTALQLIDPIDTSYITLVAISPSVADYLEFATFASNAFFRSLLPDIKLIFGMVSLVLILAIIGCFFLLFRPFINKLLVENEHIFVMIRMIPQEYAQSFNNHMESADD